MTNPQFLVLPDREYREALHQTFGPKGNSGIWYYDYFGAIPRAHRVGQTIIAHADHADNHQLIAHEYAHCMGIHHPKTMLKAVIHAIRTGFDTTAFTGLLRLRKTPRQVWVQYEQWRRQKQ